MSKHKIPNPFKKDAALIITIRVDMNGGQMVMAMYGALQKTMQKVERLESRIS